MAAGRIHKKEEVARVKLPIIGKIRVGEKVKNASGVEYPVSLDYFKPTGEYAAKFSEAFGPKPTSIGIVFINDDPAQSCNERYELRDKKTGNLLGFGDGVNFELWDFDLKEYRKFLIETEDKKKLLADFQRNFANGEQWRVILTLEFVIPKIASVMGLWKFETKGVASSIGNIRDTFDQIQMLADTVVNVPFDLRVQKVSSQKPGERKSYPVVNLIPNVGQDKLDEVRNFLQQGHSLRDIKSFLAGTTTLQIGSGENK